MPRMGILAWQLLSVTIIGSILLAGAVLALPEIPASDDMTSFLIGCAAAFHDHLVTPGGLATAVVGVGASLSVACRIAWKLTQSAREARRVCAAHHRQLSLLGRRDEESDDVWVLEHPVPAAFCIPGRHREIVVTSSALAVLRAPQLRAVLAHERAHLAGRHDLVLVVASALRAALPWLRVFAEAEAALRRLIEMRADDVALRRSNRTALAEALVRLAQGSAPDATLAAAGEAALARVRRLAEPQPQSTKLAGLNAFLLSAALLAVPTAILLVTLGFCGPQSA